MLLDIGRRPNLFPGDRDPQLVGSAHCGTRRSRSGRRAVAGPPTLVEAQAPAKTHGFLKAFERLIRDRYEADSPSGAENTRATFGAPTGATAHDQRLR